MSEEIARIHQPAAEISEEALKRAEELIEQEEGVQNKFRGRLADFITAVGGLMSPFPPLPAQPNRRPQAPRPDHLAVLLVRFFFVVPGPPRLPPRQTARDCALAA